MICLSHPIPGSLQRAQQQGWSFHYSAAFDEWTIITRNAAWKRAVLAKYKMGVAVYTVGEVEAVRGMSEGERVGVHLLVREFGASIE